ncbi:tricorn protease (plasmid) [Fulvitalea axinellae]|uniref:Tricorn protease homolog n=1 Tax=Fulvitalea axinellae TaxID=1182444 RepID=A0AAU9CSE7_9BACT|nr:tricorn protease [Fulvitalea axinellae]
MRKTFRFLLAFALMAVVSDSFAGEIIRWLRYPAISPDGKQVVFSYQGDLYMVPTSGGEAQALTRHKAYDHSPVWSPDGKSLAFASDRHGNFDIFRIDLTTGQTTRLTYHSSSDTPASFTADGSRVLFQASRMDTQQAHLFPSGVLSELYSVPVSGGRVERILTTPALKAQYSPDGSKIIYYDRKGYENAFRKHHKSSVTRDVWVYDVASKKHKKLTDFEGEDRDPVWDGDGSFFFLSESDGNFNVYKSNISGGTPKQVSSFDKHPVRYLTRANDGTLCYAFHGDLYTQKEGGQPKKIEVTARLDRVANDIVYRPVSGGASEFALSPNGKEIAFVSRGEVYVTSKDYSTTKRITNTPEQERSVSFSPDGKKLLYAGEKNGSWNLYEASIKRDGEKYFYNATLIKETPLLVSEDETFQPSYSPDGKEVAFLSERTTLKVINLKSKKVRTVLAGDRNYSYADGDQHYAWSPDSKWFLVQFLIDGRWQSNAGLLAADGKSGPIDLTKSGYSDSSPKWTMDGKAMIWFTDRNGYRSHGSWGSQSDAYAMFFDQDAYDKFRMSKEEYELAKEAEKDSKKGKKEAKKEEKDKKKEEAGKTVKKKEKTLKLDIEGTENRIARLTSHSSRLADALLTKDGKTLYYLTSFEGGFDLWKHDLKSRSTKLLTKLKSGYSKMVFDKGEKNIYFISGGRIKSVAVPSGRQKTISFRSEMEWNPAAEREYMYEHAWRQFREKFYKTDLHGVDWDFYKAEYAQFLPYINNNYDFADLLSELLGEANASHTGSGYRSYSSNGDRTASLGVFYDESFEGDGLKIAEVLDKSPVLKKDSKIEAGVIITSIDGKPILANANYNELLNRKVGKTVLLGLKKGGKTWEEKVKPVSTGMENQLLYERWVKNNRAKVDKLSGGRIGYVHVRGMNSSSFREVYSELLGRYNTKEAVIVDTRFNGGGWLHDDLATLLSGKRYLNFSPRGQDNMGGDPLGRWTKPSCILVGESNYSDAHMFPYVYKTLGIGKVIGMPVPGTATAVWWESMIDKSIYFGIPQIGMKTLDGQFLENNQLEPDVKVSNDPESVANGEDKQIQTAVQELLKDLK